MHQFDGGLPLFFGFEQDMRHPIKQNITLLAQFHGRFDPGRRMLRDKRHRSLYVRRTI